MKIFEEDFQRERSDRERMNEEKEELKKQVEKLQAQVNLTCAQVRSAGPRCGQLAVVRGGARASGPALTLLPALRHLSLHPGKAPPRSIL